MSDADLARRTIRDFGEQWTAYTDNDGYYGSPEILQDVLGPLASAVPLAGARVADVGAGTGRWVHILLAAGAAHVVAVEPSAAYEVLRRNTAELGDRVSCLHAPGDGLPPDPPLDVAFSFGVVHHVPRPAPVMEAIWRALRPGGRCVLWLYGREGNRAYLLALAALTTVTRRLPHRVLAALTWLLYGPLVLYMGLCRHVRAPLAGYLREVFARLTPEKRRLVIYDQLNPAYAKYYTREEARALLEDAGFEDVRLHHRHGYSWTVVGSRPGGDRGR